VAPPSDAKKAGCNSIGVDVPGNQKRFGVVVMDDAERREDMKTQRGRRTTTDRWIEDWPWVGGKPGKAASKVFWIWFLLLVLMAFLILLAFITMHICLAVALILVTAVIGTLPTLFLYGSRI